MVLGFKHEKMTFWAALEKKPVNFRNLNFLVINVMGETQNTFPTLKYHLSLITTDERLQ